MAGIDKAVARGIAGVSLWSSRNAKVVVGLVLVATLVLGYGITLITTDVDTTDVLPRGDPNTDAAKKLTRDFRSTFTQQVTFQLHVDESTEHWRTDNDKLPYRYAAMPGIGDIISGIPASFETAPDPHNITDEVYIRAMEELAQFIERETDFTFNRQISINNLYALINWTVAGGEGRAPEEAFALPGYGTPQDAFSYQVVDYGVKVAILDAVSAITSPSWNHAALLFMPAADNDETMRALGDKIIAARDLYVEAVDNGETTFTVWGSHNPPLFTVDFPVANSHSSTLVEQDLVRLMPWIALFIVASLFVAFRNFRSILISFTSLGIGVVWTYGAMGYMGIALNTLNMTIVPLIMGVGIDYAIHMINEFLEHKAEGKTDAEAFRIAGGRAGLAMFIATATTALGLVVMMMSPSLLMAQLGLLSAIAITATYVLTITFIPAALTLIGGTEKMGASFKPSRTMPAVARFVTKTRFLMLILVLGLTVVAYTSAVSLDEEAFGDPGKNFPPDDPIRLEHEQGLRYFYEMEDPDVKANILTFEGPGILTPESIEYMRAIEANLKTKDRVIADTLRTLPFFIETWQTVKGGPVCAGIVVGSGPVPGGVGGILDPVVGGAGQGGAPCADQLRFPATEEEIRAEVEGMFASPMRELGSIIINHPKLDMAAMTFSVRAETFDDAAEVWDQVWSAVEAADRQFGGGPPEGVHVAFVGNTATNYLFVEQQLPWLTYMSIAATIILFLMVFIFTRDIKATLIATFTAGITSLWWLGILPLINIGLAITLMLPLVFIFNIGTDYVVHIIWNLKQVGNPREVFGTVGKAILFSAITTAGAFAFFIAIQNVAVSRTMFATTLAIFIIFFATMMVIPAFYKVQAKGEKPPRGGALRDLRTSGGGPTDDGKPLVAVKRPKGG